MQSQTITQTLNILVGNQNGNLASTGISLLTIIISAIALITTSIFTWRFLAKHTKHTKLNFRSLSAIIFLSLATTALALNLQTASAAPTLTIASDQTNLTITVPEGGGTASATTTLTTGTASPSGYTLTANLSQPEPGISIKLKGGNITTSTDLTPGAPALTLKTTTEANPTNTPDTTEVTLSFTIDGTVTPGKKELKLNYSIADNEVEEELATLQSFTTAQCNALPTYTGSNEEAVIELTDTRGDNQIYQVAKLADGNCWMLDNLKLGSTTGTLELTPQDTNIVSNLTLPQVTASAPMDTQEEIDALLDTPFVFGPVPGDTNSGATNYGYLYNWSAATAGESRTSHDENAGNAPYSICPANWRLPTGGPGGEFSALDIAFGGTGNGANNGEPNIALWQHDGPFKGVFSGYWGGGFDVQGDYGVLWSASAYPGYADYAFFAYFLETEVSPGFVGFRFFGFGVRCLLN
ncbi:hypothetical protein H6801_02250 [Candidatus Nomurabacteria bacterium]|nr:hypothetical protein [Candidatus Nomurabacteria bacterium]